MAIELNTLAGRDGIAISKKDTAGASSGIKKWLGQLQGGRVQSQERMFFTEQLSLLLETGVNLAAALRMLEKQTDNPVFSKIIRALHADINEGKSFSSALSQHPEVFSSTYINLVGASEGGGFMHRVLNELLEMDERFERLKSILVAAVSYPAFLLVFSLAVVVFVLVVVFPKFSEMFASIADELPATTIGLMALSHVFLDYWPWLLLGSTAFVVLLLRWLKTESGNITVDRLKLKTPLIRNIFIELYLVQSMRVMGLSLSNGVSVMDSLAACRDVVRNRLYRDLYVSLEQQVQHGQGLASGYLSSEYVPPLVQQMIATGEESGSLAMVMSRIAGFYEIRLEKRLQAMSKAAEPLMLLIMGVVVGVLVSSLILPIFKLSRAVG